MGLKLPPNVGTVDVLAPVNRVRKVRKYREDDREDSDSFFEEDTPETYSPENMNEAQEVKEEDQESSPADQYPHIDDYV